MKTFAKIAWRNIWRNKYRSLLTISGISGGLAALIFIRAFIDGGDAQMVENYTSLFSGHIQIHKKGFHKRVSLDLSMENPQEIENILQQNAQILAFSRRIKDYALISSTENSSGVLLIGIDPWKEKYVTTLHKKIRKGRFLVPGKNDEIIVGKDLACILNVDLGDKVVIMSQGFDGSLCASAYRVCGILDSGAEEIDRGLAFITLSSAQDLLILGNKISELIVRSSSIYLIDRITEKLKEKIDTNKFEILSWKEISPIIQQWIEFDRAFSNVILLVVLLVVSASILNTMLMAVLERVKEFGIMLALGTKRRQIVLMVGLESLFLGTFGVILGTSLGLILAKYFSYKGIDLSKFSQALEAYYTGSVIYPKIFLGHLLLWALIVLLVSILVSLYPAYKASNLKPADAIRF